MANTEVGNLSRLAYAAEAVFGTTPATPTGIIVRQAGFTLDADRAYIDNPELRQDSMRQAGRGGALYGKGTITGKLSYGTYDDLFAASLGNFVWASNVVKIRAMVSDTAATIAVAAAGKTFTRADGGDFTADGFMVNDRINTAGFTNAGNNGSFVISAVSALVITCSTASGLVDESANAACSISLNRRPSFTFERAHLVNGLYFAFPGCVMDGFDMTGKVDQSVDVNFNFLSKSVSVESGTTIYTSLTQPNTNPLITAWDGTVKRNTVQLANVVSWTLKSTANLDTAKVVGASSIYDIMPKSVYVTGTMELYFSDYAAYTDMRAENDVALQLNLGPGGTKSYTFDLTRTRIKTWKSTPKEGLMTAVVEWESYVPVTGSNTSLMLTRLP